MSFENAAAAATVLVSDISSSSDDFADWNGATVVLDETYFDLDGRNSSYSYDVMANGQYAGYVIVSATRDNYPILEFAKGITADKDPRTVARAEQLARSQITNPRQELGKGQPLYLGATFFAMAYPVQMNNARMGHQQISDDWIFVDLTENRLIDPDDQGVVQNNPLQLNESQMKQQEEFQQQKIKDANAEWDSLENNANSGTLKAVELVSAGASRMGGRTWLDVPAYLWKWGCTPTSSSMVLGYLRGKGLTSLPASDGYGDPLNHELADQMNTIYNKTGFCDPLADNKYTCGMTVPTMTDVGITSELQAHGISHWAGISNLDYSFAMDAAEIDKGYPFVLSMAYQEIYYLHSVAVIGYDSAGYLIIHDTWDTGSHYIHYGNWVGAQDTHVYPLLSHTVTASAGPHGSISPAGSLSVPDMLSETFTITPETGYMIDEIRDNGVLETQNPYTIDHVTSDHTITVTFKPIASPGVEWNWATDGWGDWQHTASWSGGSGSEYGPVMVNNAEGNHGEHGTDVGLSAGSTQSSVWKTFSDPSGSGWNTITFKGLMTASDVPGGRWMTLDINGNQVFGGTASQIPPGNGVPFEITQSFTESPTVTVKITNGQSPAWGPRFAMHYYSVKLSRESTTAVLKAQSTPFTIPDGKAMATNVTAPDTTVTP